MVSCLHFMERTADFQYFLQHSKHKSNVCCRIVLFQGDCELAQKEKDGDTKRMKQKPAEEIKRER